LRLMIAAEPGGRIVLAGLTVGAATLAGDEAADMCAADPAVGTRNAPYWAR